MENISQIRHVPEWQVVTKNVNIFVSIGKKKKNSTNRMKMETKCKGYMRLIL